MSGKMATLKANKINSMSRATRKNYLTDKVFKTSRSLANTNLHIFANDPVRAVESNSALYKYGIYSTVSSTASLLIYGALR